MTTAFGKSNIMGVNSRTATARIMPYRCKCGAQVEVTVEGLPVFVTVAEWMESLTDVDRDLIHYNHDEDATAKVRSAKITKPVL